MAALALASMWFSVVALLLTAPAAGLVAMCGAVPLQVVAESVLLRGR